MDLADSWLGVPKLLTPEEIINPNVDEQSMMTYLSQFPNAKVKEGAPFREKALASKVRAHGPGDNSFIARRKAAWDRGCPWVSHSVSNYKRVNHCMLCNDDIGY